MKRFLFFFLCFSIAICGETVSAQSKNKKQKNPAKDSHTAVPVPVVPASESNSVEASPQQSGKKNHRDAASSNENGKKVEPIATVKMPYFYEFTQPDFLVKHVIIEHDETGRGTITFEKRNLDEAITDPIEINAETLERIKKLWSDLNFLDSTENYQSAKYDYPHLGQMKLRMEIGEKRRETQLNWTENKTAESLTKEYKSLTERYIWLFDLNLARENQPLEAPKLMEKIEGLIKRGEIKDAATLLPVLHQAKDDERIPLIARNHAERIIKTIEKTAEKK